MSSENSHVQNVHTSENERVGATSSDRNPPVKLHAMHERTKELESNLHKGLAHPDSISASLFSLHNRPSRPEDLVAAQALTELANPGARVPYNAQVAEIHEVTKGASELAISRSTSSPSDNDAAKSDAALSDPKEKAAASSKKRARTHTAPRKVTKPAARPTITAPLTPPTTPPTAPSMTRHRSSLTGRLLTGANSAVGEELDDDIWAAERLWRGPNGKLTKEKRAKALAEKVKAQAEKAKAEAAKKEKKAEVSKKRKSSAVEEAGPSGDETGKTQTVPVEKKRKRGGATAKGSKQPASDTSPLAQSVMAEGSVAVTTAISEQKQQGKGPKRIRKSPTSRRSS